MNSLKDPELSTFKWVKCVCVWLCMCMWLPVNLILIGCLKCVVEGHLAHSVKFSYGSLHFFGKDQLSYQELNYNSREISNNWNKRHMFPGGIISLQWGGSQGVLCCHWKGRFTWSAQVLGCLQYSSKFPPTAILLPQTHFPLFTWFMPNNHCPNMTSLPGFQREMWSKGSCVWTLAHSCFSKVVDLLR